MYNKLYLYSLKTRNIWNYTTEIFFVWKSKKKNVESIFFDFPVIPLNGIKRSDERD